MRARRSDTFERMGSERGQASVEWIAILLAMTIALAAVGRFAGREDHRGLPTILAHSVTCAARDGCRHAQMVGISRKKRAESQPPRSGARGAPPETFGAPREAFSAPPLVPGSSTRSRPGFSAPSLVPSPGAPRPRPAAHAPGGRALLEWARRQPGRRLLEWARARVGRERLGPLRPALRGRLRAGAGRAWRTAWFACLVYERVRWAILHPESRSHEYEFPPSEALRILNDCISPLDLVRDWPLLTTR